MNFLTKKSMTPLELTLKFILALAVSYLLYFNIIRDYGTFLMLISSNIVASLFDMKVINTGSYLEDVKLVSTIGLQNSITHEIAFAELPLPKMIVDKIMIVITNTSMILALILLLVRSFKILAIVLTLMITLHIFSISATLAYFMFEVSPQSPILLSYLQAIGVTPAIFDISYIISGISFYYLKYFSILLIAYYIWETEGYTLTEKSNVSVSIKNSRPVFFKK